MKSIIFNLSKQQVSLFKGFAIILIVFHNFFHKIQPSVGENEFSFSKKIIDNFLTIFPHINWVDKINLTFSIWGHYGVAIFVLLSGYGLFFSWSKKIEGDKKQPILTYFIFLFERVKKLYPTLLLALGVLCLFEFYTNYKIPTGTTFISYLVKLSFTSNLFPYELFSLNGPWWFYSLIVQLYVLLPILYFISKKTKGYGLILISIIAILGDFFIGPNFEKSTLINYFALPFHYIPLFSTGILLAQYSKKSINIFIILGISITLFVLGNFYFSFWIISSLMFSIFAISLLKLISIENYLGKILIFFGQISMYLFALHGFFRNSFYKYMNYHTSSDESLFMAIIFFSLCSFLAWSMSFVEPKVKELTTLSYEKIVKKSILLKVMFFLVLAFSFFLILKTNYFFESDQKNETELYLKEKYPNALFLYHSNFETKKSINKLERIKSSEYSYSGNYSLKSKIYQEFTPILPSFNLGDNIFSFNVIVKGKILVKKGDKKITQLVINLKGVNDTSLSWTKHPIKNAIKDVKLINKEEWVDFEFKKSFSAKKDNYFNKAKLHLFLWNDKNTIYYYDDLTIIINDVITKEKLNEEKILQFSSSFENKNSEFYKKNIDSTISHTGKKAIRVQDEIKFIPLCKNYKISEKDLKYKKLTWNSNFHFLTSKIQNKYGKIVIQVQRKGIKKPILWYQKNLIDLSNNEMFNKNKWYHLHINHELDNKILNLQKDDIIKFFFWKDKKNEFYYDDLEIELVGTL